MQGTKRPGRRYFTLHVTDPDDVRQKQHRFQFPAKGERDRKAKEAEKHGFEVQTADVLSDE